MNSVLITGCSRGIGLELAYQYARDGARVHACARAPERSEALQALAARFPQLIELHALDITQDSQIRALAQALGDSVLDLVIHNAGCYGPSGVKFGEVDREIWHHVLNTNTVSPMMLTQALVGRVAASGKGIVAFISSKVGSIADNHSGGGYYYRSSKTALNQVVKSLSVDLAGYGIRVVALHPGWVKTDMGGPNALIEPEESVRGMRQQLDRLTAQQSGSFLNYDGSVIPW